MLFVKTTVEPLLKHPPIERPIIKVPKQLQHKMVNSTNEGSSIVVTSIQRFKGLIHLVELYFKNMMKGNTV